MSNHRTTVLGFFRPDLQPAVTLLRDFRCLQSYWFHFVLAVLVLVADWAMDFSTRASSPLLDWRRVPGDSSIKRRFNNLFYWRIVDIFTRINVRVIVMIRLLFVQPWFRRIVCCPFLQLVNVTDDWSTSPRSLNHEWGSLLVVIL